MSVYEIEFLIMQLMLGCLFRGWDRLIAAQCALLWHHAALVV